MSPAGSVMDNKLIESGLAYIAVAIRNAGEMIALAIFFGLILGSVMNGCVN